MPTWGWILVGGFFFNVALAIVCIHNSNILVARMKRNVDGLLEKPEKPYSDNIS